jgi:hypothetical protein
MQKAWYRCGEPNTTCRLLTNFCPSLLHLVSKILLPQRDDATPSRLSRAQVGSDESQGEPLLARGGAYGQQVGGGVQSGVDERRKQLGLMVIGGGGGGEGGGT